ncbi:alpha/beta hydrolase fold domain-containing protein [Aureliella helgolandensis]|uniref:Uncharacterized protein n=1 Tax=Aureliella helgolandensis TaxID=2527968 RepID=A0A518G0M5_9BACT|nr:alpha/beta hydrolase fold domain-containing protein [Aureliella helgolandensis]QDV22157.1 hypothetical protein Q31a_04400 [Aureliella helgolandensis]
MTSPETSTPRATPIKRRAVFLVGGYEPKSSAAFFARTRRELARFCDTWQVTAEMEQATTSPDGMIASAHIEAEIDEKSVATAIHFLVWNDIVLHDFGRPKLLRVAKYLGTLANYLFTGTFHRIVTSAWRVALFFLYPGIMLAAFCWLAGILGWAVSRLAFPGATACGVLAAVALLWGLLQYSGQRWFVTHLMDLWSFSLQYLRDRRPEVQQHVDRFAEAIVDQARTGDEDEIVLVGHSAGGTLILDIAARALELFPELGQSGPRVIILTLGSIALNVGLHPAAKTFRRKVQSLVDAPSLEWIECQAHVDIVNFYRTDPVAAMKLHSTRPGQFPEVHIVRIRKTVSPEFYKRYRYSLFRFHYQFIMANTTRYPYDFFMMCCGPEPFRESLGQELRYNPH